MLEPGQRINLEDLNKTELLALYRQHHDGLALTRNLTHARLVELVETGAWPRDDEVAGTMLTRRLLEQTINLNPARRKRIESQLPCHGWRNGFCLHYPCPEGRHCACYLENEARVTSTL
jgi:hypothetical protein